MTKGVRSYARLFTCAVLLAAATAGDSSVPRGSTAAVAGIAAQDTELRSGAADPVALLPKTDADETMRPLPTHKPISIAREWE